MPVRPGGGPLTPRRLGDSQPEASARPTARPIRPVLGARRPRGRNSCRRSPDATRSRRGANVRADQAHPRSRRDGPRFSHRPEARPVEGPRPGGASRAGCHPSRANPSHPPSVAAHTAHCIKHAFDEAGNIHSTTRGPAAREFSGRCVPGQAVTGRPDHPSSAPQAWQTTPAPRGVLQATDAGQRSPRSTASTSTRARGHEGTRARGHEGTRDTAARPPRG